jgi:phosphatidylglycerophosphatase A
VFEGFLDSWLNYLLFFFFILISFLIGLYIYPRTVEEENDPGSFGWDEFVGMWVACLPLSFIGTSLFWLSITLVLFRLFDIWKPFGIKFFDKKHGAFYVMIDDVLAGFYSGILVIFLSLFFL